MDRDYRAFVFASHPAYGMILLHCTRKKRKPPHFQCPGGHVDQEDFVQASGLLGQNLDRTSPELLNLAGQIGAARELHEETGIDARKDLDRLEPVRLRASDNGDRDSELENELKGRLFFRLTLADSDFIPGGNYTAMNGVSPDLKLRLSHEHQGFIFEPDPKDAPRQLLLHSGGKVSKALEMALQNDDYLSNMTAVEEVAERERNTRKEETS